MKSWKIKISLIFLIAAMSGCALNSPKAAQNPNLPAITSLKTISELTEIAFEWESVGDENVDGFYLYRTDHGENNATKLIANIKDRFATHYVDSGLKPGNSYTYEMKSYDKFGNYSQNGVQVLAKTESVIAAVPFIQAIYGLPHKTKILWRPHPDLRVQSYILERNDISSEKWSKIAELKGRLNAEFIDSGLDANHHYRYRIFAKTYGGIISEASEVVSAQTKPLPNIVTNATASTNLPKKITLKWDENTNEDFSHFVIYRSSSALMPFIKIATTKATSFDDLINENGATMSYKITAIDKDGLESPRQKVEITGSTLESPKEPFITKARLENGEIKLGWDAGSDGRSVKFTIIKDSPKGQEIWQDIYGGEYSDADLPFLGKYTYKIIGVDEFGLNSKPSLKAVVEIK